MSQSWRASLCSHSLSRSRSHGPNDTHMRMVIIEHGTPALQDAERMTRRFSTDCLERWTPMRLYSNIDGFGESLWVYVILPVILLAHPLIRAHQWLTDCWQGLRPRQARTLQKCQKSKLDQCGRDEGTRRSRSCRCRLQIARTTPCVQL
jgi:hypothetical protein